MRYFVTTEPGSDPGYIEGTDGTRIRPTPAYVEYVRPGSHGFYVMYWLNVAPAAFFVVTCWDEQDIGFPVHMLSDTKAGPGIAQSAIEAWPTFMRLVANTAQPHPRFSEGVIAHIEDPDSGDMKWVIGSFLGNHPMDNVEDLFSARSAAVSSRVFELSGHVGAELGGTPLTALPNVARNVYRSANQAEREQALKFVGQYAPKVMNIALSSLVGDFLSSDS